MTPNTKPMEALAEIQELNGRYKDLFIQLSAYMAEVKEIKEKYGLQNPPRPVSRTNNRRRN